jgi:hypothetical protein
MTRVAYRGWVSVSGASDMATGYNPGAGGVKLTQNSASLGVIQVTEDVPSEAWNMGAGRFAIVGRNGTDGLSYARNSSGTKQHNRGRERRGPHLH